MPGAVSSPPRLLSWTPLLLALTPALLVSLAPLGNTDVWFHLATGRLIATTHSIPRTEVFSFTARGEPWVAHEWLWELGAWELWRAFSAAGVIAFRVAQSWIALGSAWGAARITGSSPLRAALATAVLSLAAARRFSDRPQMLTLAAFGVLLALLELHRLGRPRPLRLLAAPLFLLWANAHSGVLYGLVLLAYELIWALWQRARTRALELALILATALAICLLLTPFGLQGLLYPFALLKLDTLLNVYELRPLWAFFDDPTFWAVPLALGLGALASLTELRRDPRSALRTLALIGAAVWHVRGVDLAALSAIPVLAAALQSLTLENERRLFALGVALTLLVSVACLAADPSRRPNIGVDVAQTPQGAVDFLTANHVTGPGYNSEALGSYLVFADPTRPVFIDGRNDPYARLMSDLAGGADPFARWPLIYALTTYTDSRLAEVRDRLPLVWFDDVSLLALRGHAELELHCLLPEGPFFAVGALPEACLAEAQRITREAAESWRAGVLEAAALSALERAPEASAALDRAGALPNAPPRDALESMRDLVLALAASGPDRTTRLDAVATRSGDPADRALASLAAGDCAPWRALIARRPSLTSWVYGPRSPVAALVNHACLAP